MSMLSHFARLPVGKIANQEVPPRGPALGTAIVYRNPVNPVKPSNPVGRPKSVITNKPGASIVVQPSVPVVRVTDELESSSPMNAPMTSLELKRARIIEQLRCGTVVEDQNIGVILVGNDATLQAEVLGARADLTSRRHYSDLETKYIRSACHKWAKDGKHTGFRTAAEIKVHLANWLGDIPEKTLSNMLTAEKRMFNEKAEGYFIQAPTLEEIRLPLTGNGHIPIYANIQETTKCGRAFVFPTSLHATLKGRLSHFKNRSGTGSSFV